MGSGTCSVNPREHSENVDSVEKILQAEQRGQQDDAIANVRGYQLVGRGRFENEEPAA
jgi:hypothetical protein